MQFSVRDWMMDLVVFVDPDTLVTDALATMRRRYITASLLIKADQSRVWHSHLDRYQRQNCRPKPQSGPGEGK